MGSKGNDFFDSCSFYEKVSLTKRRIILLKFRIYVPYYWMSIWIGHIRLGSSLTRGHAADGRPSGSSLQVGERGDWTSAKGINPKFTLCIVFFFFEGSYYGWFVITAQR
jgi:hypothetical protein